MVANEELLRLFNFESDCLVYAHDVSDINKAEFNIDDVTVAQDEMYRCEFLNMLRLDDYDDEVVTRKLNVAFESMRANPALNRLLTEFAVKYEYGDLDTGLVFLFSFDYLYYTYYFLRRIAHDVDCDFTDDAKYKAVFELIEKRSKRENE